MEQMQWMRGILRKRILAVNRGNVKFVVNSNRRKVMKKYQSIHNANLRMVAAVLKAGNAIDARVSCVLKTEGLTHIQFNILRILQGASPDPLSAGQINERLMFTKSDVTRLLDRLENKGLLLREMCSYNRRKLEIRITEAGSELCNALLPRIEEATAGFYQEVLSAEDRDAVIRAMDAITEQASHAQDYTSN